MTVPAGASWLIDRVGTSAQFTGADFTDDDRLYAKTAEDFVRNEILPQLERIESKEEGLMPALVKRAGELGLLMIDVPVEYGGRRPPQTRALLGSRTRAPCAPVSTPRGP